MIKLGTLLLAVALLASTIADGRAVEPLGPSGLLLVYNGADRSSRELAAYYAKVRGVPQDRFCPLHLSAELEEIAPSLFEQAVRRPIRTFIREHNLEGKIRGIVTFYGLPIRLSALRALPEAPQLRATWQRQLDDGLDDLMRAMRDMAPLADDDGPTTRPATQPAEQYLATLQEYARIRNLATHKVQELLSQGVGQAENQRLIAILEQVEGTESLLNQVNVPPGSENSPTAQQVRQYQAEVRKAMAEAEETMAGDATLPQRDEARHAIRRYRGLLGYMASLQNDINCLNAEESIAAFDNELMLLYWDSYPRARWMLNMLNWRVRTNAGLRVFLPPGQDRRPVMIVGRIDGPTAAVARRMIDDAVAAEKVKLQGDIYLDARGLEKNAVGYGDYDEDLRDFAELLKKHVPLPSHLDNQPRLFQAGECPRTLLYCGWYSVRDFVDAFDFVPGAVGYHIASFEALSLKKPGEKGWCRGLLLDGIAATLGPVAEPYLQSFPKPSEFLGLLLTGRFTLGECYAYTLPMTSWMQMLLGDPLYRPFANQPMLKVGDVFPQEAIPPEFR